MEIVIRNLSKKIGKAEVLKGINLTFTENCIYGLKGQNGSGKTMLLRSISGLMKPTIGEVLINGKKLYEAIKFPESIGILIENPSFLMNQTGYKNLEILAQYVEKDRNKIKESVIRALERVGLDPNDKRKYRKYSLGMKQKLGIAAAILGEPDIIILDEPINALDQESAARIHNVLLELKKEHIIIIAAHDKEELEKLVDVCYEIRDGVVVNE